MIKEGGMREEQENKTCTKLEFKIGDIVEYKGEKWEIGFENKKDFAGTFRLQKGPSAYDEKINYIWPEDLRRVE